MKRGQMIWGGLLVLAAIWIIFRIASGVMPAPTSGKVIGTWVAVFFTFALFSFLYRDNPFYKFAEHAFVGVSAAYWMVVGFWEVIEPNLIGKLAPDFTRATFRPGLSPDAQTEWQFLIPLILGILLLWRLSPKGGWIARWPLAFIIGATAGFRLIGFLEADFLLQTRESIRPFVSFGTDGAALDINRSIINFLTVLGTLCALVYFFFSVEHKGVVGRISRVGIWVLMITFGAGFGFTVMGRIALLVGRIHFLLYEWLQISPP